MHYVSTRGQAPHLAFDDVLLTGLARDGGLYVPESWPRLDADAQRSLRGLPYPALAARVMAPFVGDTVAEDDLKRILEDAYAGFHHAAVAPLRQAGPETWVMELFHGPTLAFKDYAMQVVGRLFDHVLERRNSRLTIVGATSGDTGSSAIEALRDRDNIDVVILHPKGRVSPIQQRQMTTVQAANVHNVAVDGTFDDCQALVKALFGDDAFRDEVNLSAVNSINWARILVQIVYYFHAGLAVGAPDRGLAFSVPTGNFGNVFAGWAARAMGLPVEQLVVGSNRNDILTRFFETGHMTTGPVQPTLSPSMDIQVSSNFERLLFELYARDGATVDRLLTTLREHGGFAVDDARWRAALALFDGDRRDDAATRDAITRHWRATGELLDPHSAIGLDVGTARRRDPATPLVSLATAHPAKFPDAVEQATGRHPALPDRLADLMTLEETYAELPVDAGVLKSFVRERIGP